VALGVAVGAVGLVYTTSAWAAGAKTVYVYDSNTNTVQPGAEDTGPSFDHNCKGYVWSKLGFLDGNGKPALDGTTKGAKITVDGKQVGTVLNASDKQANSYQNSDGSVQAYDLARGAKLSDAFKGLNKGDTLVICKHGGSVGDGHGGQIQLDNGKFYEGFSLADQNGAATDKGTNVPNDIEDALKDPYPLPKKDGVKVVLYTCYGGAKPSNGDKSVAATLAPIVGKGNVTAYASPVLAGGIITVTVTGSGPNAKKLEGSANEVLNAAGVKAGYANVEDWIFSLPFADQLKAVEDVIKGDPTLKGKIKAKIEYPDPKPVSGTGGTSLGDPEADSPVEYAGSPLTLSFGEPASFVMDLPQDGLARWTTLDVVEANATSFSGLPTPLDSRVFEVIRPDQEQAMVGVPIIDLFRPARITVRYLNSASNPELYQFSGGQWTKVSNTSVDAVHQTISAYVDELSTFVVLDRSLQPKTGSAPKVSGTYQGAVTVAMDPAGHSCCVFPATSWNVLQVLDTTTGAITITLGPVFQGINLNSPLTGTGAPFVATGTGTVAGYPNTEVDFSGTVTPQSGLHGTLTVGQNGSLPTGQSITFKVDMTKVT